MPFVLLAALGLFAPLLVILAIRLRRRTSALFVLFPLLLVANFLAMFLGLALDFSRSTPDELSHRPVIVMYFAVVAWVGGAAGLSLLESRRLGRIARPAIVCLAVLLMAVPAFLGSGVQRMWAMRMPSLRLSEFRSASIGPRNTCATTAPRRMSSRIRSSIGPTPWLPCRSDGRLSRVR